MENRVQPLDNFIKLRTELYFVHFMVRHTSRVTDFIAGHHFEPCFRAEKSYVYVPSFCLLSATVKGSKFSLRRVTRNLSCDLRLKTQMRCISKQDKEGRKEHEKFFYASGLLFSLELHLLPNI
jgi:hypothetical protein